MSATTPVGISNTTIPAVYAALAANACEFDSPASSKKSVLMPQINDAARALVKVSRRYVRSTRSGDGVIGGGYENEGPARPLWMSLSHRCTSPGCRVPTRRCQADHTIPWSQGGRTDPDNGGPKCGRDNLLGNHGYTTTRDRHGNWHHHRPDGTEIRWHGPRLSGAGRGVR